MIRSRATSVRLYATNPTRKKLVQAFGCVSRIARLIGCSPFAQAQIQSTFRHNNGVPKIHGRMIQAHALANSTFLPGPDGAECCQFVLD
jgi:hypothetical protein